MDRIGIVSAIAIVAFCLHPLGAGASRLTWGGGYSWSVGETSNVYVVDGVTLTVTINDLNTPPALDPNPEPLGSPGSPQTSNYIDPVGNGGGESLFIKAPGNSSGIEITVDFDALVSSVSYEIFDVDATGSSGLGDYIDVVQSVATDGATFFSPSSVTGSGSEVWTLQGDGQTIVAFENADQTGGNSADGTALWSFDVPLTSITISYDNNDPVAGVQWISFSHIDFVETPEPSTGLLVGLGIVGLALRRRNARRRLA